MPCMICVKCTTQSWKCWQLYSWRLTGLIVELGLSFRHVHISGNKKRKFILSRFGHWSVSCNGLVWITMFHVTTLENKFVYKLRIDRVPFWLTLMFLGWSTDTAYLTILVPGLVRLCIIVRDVNQLMTLFQEDTHLTTYLKQQEAGKHIHEHVYIYYTLMYTRILLP